VLCMNVVCVAFAGHNLPDVSYYLYFFVLLILSISVKCSVHLCWLNKSLKWTRLVFHIISWYMSVDCCFLYVTTYLIRVILDMIFYISKRLSKYLIK